MTAADLLIKGLRDRGVEWIATLCGHGLDPLLNAAREAGVRLVDVRNEQTCAYIADSFGRLTRRPGVCAVSSGVAQINALTGVANAWFDSAPMLLISGAGATATAGKGHFQDLDQVALARPITRFSASIDDPGSTLRLLDEAWTKAIDPRGPVHLMFPLDVQVAEAGEDPVGSAGPSDARGSAGNVGEIARALAKAQAPLVIAGSGVFYNRTAADMLDFCRRFDIPVVTPIWDRGTVDQPNPIFLGIVGAATGEPEILRDADCLLLAGVEIDYRIGYLQPPAIRQDASIFRLDGGWRELAEAMGAEAKDAVPRKAWASACLQRRNEFRDAVKRRAEEQPRDKMHALDVIRAIEKLLPEDPVLLFDGGSIGQWAHQLLCRDRYPGDWLTCGRSGVVGWGIGGAMAARLAFPGRPVILLSGDGAFTFNVGDLECAARQKLPFVAIVADDEAWGITRVGHVRQYGTPVASALGPIAFDLLAQSLGARGVRATTPDEVDRELRIALDQPAVTVIHVPIVGGNP